MAISKLWPKYFNILDIFRLERKKEEDISSSSLVTVFGNLNAQWIFFVNFISFFIL